MDYKTCLGFQVRSTLPPCSAYSVTISDVPGCISHSSFCLVVWRAPVNPFPFRVILIPPCLLFLFFLLDNADAEGQRALPTVIYPYCDQKPQIVSPKLQSLSITVQVVIFLCQFFDITFFIFLTFCFRIILNFQNKTVELFKEFPYTVHTGFTVTTSSYISLFAIIHNPHPTSSIFLLTSSLCLPFPAPRNPCSVFKLKFDLALLYENFY